MNARLLDDAELLSLAGRLRADVDPRETLAHVIWNVITEPGDATGGALRAKDGAVTALESALRPGLLEATAERGLAEGRRRWFPRAEPGLVRAALTAALNAEVHALLPCDAAWPTALRDLGEHAPVMLWVRGLVAGLNDMTDAVSIVGARAATPYGEQIARELAGDLAQRGHTIVSGGAYGIDGCAHRAALGAGGKTIAFLAGGVDRAYPAGHVSLFRQIAEFGVLLSEVPCGGTPTKWRFLARNRLIGAFGAGTVVVEAGWRSGSLNTAGHAAALGRPLGAVPGPVTSATSAGCHRLIREYGAQCVTSAADVREMIGLGDHEPHPRRSADEHDRMRLGDALSSRSARNALDIAQRSGLSVERVEGLLGLLALEGAVERDANGWMSTR